jgi:hypothetical protein
MGMVKINVRQSHTAFLITFICFGLGVANSIVAFALPPAVSNSTVAAGDYLYLLPLFMAIFIPAMHFPRLMSLGAKRMDLFKSSILTLIPAAAAVSLASIVLHKTVDVLLLARFEWILSLTDAFGFMQRGPVIAFFQLGAFLLFFCCALHTLTLIQGRWYGWLTDILIVAVISVFTPIAPLRAALGWFFTMIIFHEFAAAQILSCLVLSAVVYCAGLAPIKSRLM